MRRNLIRGRVTAAVMLILAVASLPYGYYLLLRWVVTAIAVWSAVVEWQSGRDGWAWVFGFVAIAFNPLFPAFFDREIWFLIDLAAAAAFVLSLRNLPSGQRESDHAA